MLVPHPCTGGGAHRGEGCPFRIPTSRPISVWPLEYRRKGPGGSPYPGLEARQARRPGTLLNTLILQTVRASSRCEARGQTRPRRAPRRSPPGSSPGSGPGPHPPSAALLPGSSCARSGPRLGSSSSMALLPHYPDVGPSPPRLYRLSAGSARVMRALLITIAETPLTLTAPSEERQHLLCADRRPSPPLAPCAPLSRSSPPTRLSTLSGPSLPPSSPSNLFPFHAFPTNVAARSFSTSASQDERDPHGHRALEILRGGDTQRGWARTPRDP